jgi:hypothetical protein
MSWRYQLVRYETPHEHFKFHFAIHEVYLDGAGKIWGFTEKPIVLDKLTCYNQEQEEDVKDIIWLFERITNDIKNHGVRTIEDIERETGQAIHPYDPETLEEYEGFKNGE